MITSQPVPGQRWISDNEPELGLGMVLKAAFGRVEMFFPAASEQRQYALKSAPLRRVEFKEGDRIKLHTGEQVTVDSVIPRGGLLVYVSKGREIAEAELSDTISFSKPEERLLVGQVDELRTFDLRVEALRRRAEHRKSPVRGFIGARVDLIPHQMFIAREVTSRLAPRVLLADEVGLGKTIEAGLILHRLHLTGRAERVLVLVPEPLIHQWFVELLRRFNLLFSIFDQERCESIEQNDSEANPFLDSQLVLSAIEFVAGDPKRAAQVLAAPWDLLIVDEAHHLQWSAVAPSPPYELVEGLAARTAGLLLLTATPQQLGAEGHFARLRLLDPDRFADLEAFLAEASHYEEVAAAVDRLLRDEPLSVGDRELFGAKSPRIRKRCEELVAGNPGARDQLVAELLDAFGPGRAMFRNTRAALSGFPERQAVLIPLESSSTLDPQLVTLKWLAALLKKLREEKVLLICRTRALAEHVHDGLQRELNVSCALFHEGLTLMQRDRNAAFFAEEDGARILICSEIGSEGRNFQFAHHLVLFDLPENPELLEQRIGRLDRIGQTSTITIHVPFVRGTRGELLARWYHEGLNAFEENVHGAAEIMQALGAELRMLLDDVSSSDAPAQTRVEDFIARSQRLRAAIGEKLQRGQDRLLELNSCRSEVAEKVIREIRERDAGSGSEEFIIQLFDYFGMHIEELGHRSYLLRPGNLLTDSLPALPEDGMSVTFSRERALSREDVAFMSWDHPLVRGALDILLGSEAGNAAFGVCKDRAGEAIFLEVHALVECVAPASLHADRFLPATPLRVLVDHTLADRSDDSALAESTLEKGDVFRLLDRGAVKKKLFPTMLEKAQTLAAERMQEVVERAVSSMESQLRTEIERLEYLREMNSHVSPAEIAAARGQKAELHAALAAARLRVDSVRLILQMA